MKQAEATTRIETVIERPIAGGTYAGLVDAVWVFGSYVAGAPNVGDVDLAVEHRSNEELDADVLNALFRDGNPYRGLDTELRGSWRNVKIVYGAKDKLERQGGFIFALVWRRGEPVSLARERLDAIALDPAAGSAPREHVFPALAGFEKQTGLRQRQIVDELLASGRVTAERVQLRDDEPASERIRFVIGRRWAETNPGAARRSHWPHGSNTLTGGQEREGTWVRSSPPPDDARLPARRTDAPSGSLS
jgi:hypothetical protein